METSTCSNPVDVKFPIPPRVSLKKKPEATIVNVGGIEVGGTEIVVIAGPCAVESREQLFETARSVKSSGARILRGGAFKPRSSPYNPEKALCDGQQSLSLDEFAQLMTDLDKIARAVDREISLPK